MSGIIPDSRGAARVIAATAIGLGLAACDSDTTPQPDPEVEVEMMPIEFENTVIPIRTISENRLDPGLVFRYGEDVSFLGGNIKN